MEIDRLKAENADLTARLTAAERTVVMSTTHIEGLCSVVSKFRGAIVFLQQRVREYRAKDEKNILNIKELAEQRKNLLGKEACKERRKLRSFASTEVPADWIAPLPTDPIDTMDLHLISSGSYQDAPGPFGAPNIAGG